MQDDIKLPKGMRTQSASSNILLQRDNYVKIIADKLATIQQFDVTVVAIQANEVADKLPLLVISLQIKEKGGEK